MLYLRRITIGNGCFIGAGSGAGPGVVIEDGSSVPVFTDLYPNRRYNKETKDDAPAR
jgi:hypothetical protein